MIGLLLVGRLMAQETGAEGGGPRLLEAASGGAVALRALAGGLLSLLDLPLPLEDGHA
jgi:hypothetical protein